MECIVWTILIVISAYLFDVPRSLKEVLAIKSGGKLNTIDYLFAAIHIGMWLQVIYYKINLMSLVNLLQTCHLILLWDSIVLLSYNPIRLLLGLLVFIMTIGVLLAILFPATEGLDQYLEAEAFFVQHYLLMITPLYLLCRHNFEFLKQIKFRFILLGGWMCFCLHWFFFAVRI